MVVKCRAPRSRCLSYQKTALSLDLMRMDYIAEIGPTKLGKNNEPEDRTADSKMLLNLQTAWADSIGENVKAL